MARELDSEPNVILAAQPTRGVDIGAAEYIHSQLIAQRSLGVAIVVISEDLDEILGLANWIAVMFEGRIVDVIDRSVATRNRRWGQTSIANSFVLGSDLNSQQVMSVAPALSFSINELLLSRREIFAMP